MLSSFKASAILCDNMIVRQLPGQARRQLSRQMWRVQRLFSARYERWSPVMVTSNAHLQGSRSLYVLPINLIVVVETQRKEQARVRKAQTLWLAQVPCSRLRCGSERGKSVLVAAMVRLGK